MSSRFGCHIKDFLWFQEVVEKNLKKKKRGGAESVDSSASAASHLEPFAVDELRMFVWKRLDF